MQGPRQGLLPPAIILAASSSDCTLRLLYFRCYVKSNFADFLRKGLFAAGSVLRRFLRT